MLNKTYNEETKRMLWEWWTNGEKYKELSDEAWMYIHSKWIEGEG